MTLFEEIIIIAMCVLGTVITRFLPFLVFSSKKPTPPFVVYLGKALPSAIFVMLIVYCLKHVDITTGYRGLPEAIACIFVVLLHMWRRQMMLSMGLGTLCYMVLIQFVFV